MRFRSSATRLTLIYWFCQVFLQRPANSDNKIKTAGMVTLPHTGGLIFLLILYAKCSKLIRMTQASP